MIYFTKQNLLFTFASNYTTNYFTMLKIHFYPFTIYQLLEERYSNTGKSHCELADLCYLIRGAGAEAEVLHGRMTLADISGRENAFLYILLLTLQKQ